MDRPHRRSVPLCGGFGDYGDTGQGRCGGVRTIHRPVLLLGGWQEVHCERWQGVLRRSHRLKPLLGMGRRPRDRFHPFSANPEPATGAELENCGQLFWFRLSVGCRVSRVASLHRHPTLTLGGLKQTRGRVKTDTRECMNRHAGGYEQTRGRG